MCALDCLFFKYNAFAFCTFLLINYMNLERIQLIKLFINTAILISIHDFSQLSVLFHAKHTYYLIMNFF